MATAKEPAPSGGWTKEYRALVKAQDKRLSEADLNLLEHVSISKGLDPVQKEIYAINRGGRTSIECSIHGLLKLCAPGLDGVQTHWYDAAGNAFDVWLQQGSPAACKVAVWRKGCSHPFEAAVRYSDFAAGGVWTKMGSVMIRKVALTHALRTGFADLIGGLYESSEMDQIDNPAPEQHQHQQATPPAPAAAAEKPTKPKRGTATKVEAPTPPENLGEVIQAIDPSVKAELMNAVAALSEDPDADKQMRVLLDFRDKAGYGSDVQVSPDLLITRNHGEILKAALAAEGVTLGDQSND